MTISQISGYQKKIMIIMSLQWHLNLIYSGGSRGEARRSQAPTFLDQTEARTAEKRKKKKSFETEPPLSQNLDDCQSFPPPPPLSSEGLDPPLI